MCFSRFLKERQYLNNVAPATIEWYTHAFKWLPSDQPTQVELKTAVLKMREKGLKATACNSAIRAINAYLHWNADPDRKCSPACSHLRIPYLTEPQNVLPTFATTHIKCLIGYKPKTFIQRRLHMIVLTLIDSGCRIDEVLSLKTADCDLDNLLFTVTGKGHKQRKIPFSFELRRPLSKYLHEFPSGLIFATGQGRKLGRRNVLRDVKRLCGRLEIRPPERTLHAFRHTFAINYLRRGGSVFHLQKVLGHTTLEMTRRYANLLTEDLQAMHQKVSLLAV